jgi:hypothetical protein
VAKLADLRLPSLTHSMSPSNGWKVIGRQTPSSSASV